MGQYNEALSIMTKAELLEEVKHYELPTGRTPEDAVAEVYADWIEFTKPYGLTLGEMWEQEKTNICKYGATAFNRGYTGI